MIWIIMLSIINLLLLIGVFVYFTNFWNKNIRIINEEIILNKTRIELIEKKINLYDSLENIL
jgi:hypothetical protein